MEPSFLYSVIIPHRNSIPTLNRALCSIPQRDDIQVIVVDNSDVQIVPYELCKSVGLYYYTGKPSAGGARNLGVQNAIGKWILFLDADDYFLPDAFTHFDEFAFQPDLDLIYFNISVEKAENREKHSKFEYLNKQVSNFLLGKTDAEWKLRLRSYPPWGKLISTRYLREIDLRFDEIAHSEDVLFSARLGVWASKIKASHHSVYCYVTHSNSLTARRDNSFYFEKFKVLVEYNKFIAQIKKSNLVVPIGIYLVRALFCSYSNFKHYLPFLKDAPINLKVEIIGILKGGVKFLIRLFC